MNQRRYALVQDFGIVGRRYQEYSEGIRGRLRHQLVFDALTSHLKPESTILDMGCGDGEMSLRLGRAGHIIVGVDTSSEMLNLARERLTSEPEAIAERVVFQSGDIDHYSGNRDFDAVCCHGVLMYLDRSDRAIGSLAKRVAPGGLLSVLTRNALAAGVREALKGDYAGALAQVMGNDTSSVGNLGITTRGDDPRQVVQMMESNGLTKCQWYGIRVFSDHLPSTMDEERFAKLLALETEVSGRDPYRSLGRLFHAIGFRPPPTASTRRS